MATEVAERPTSKTSLIVRIAERYGIEPGKFYTTLRNTFQSPEVEITEDALLRLALVIQEYNLNPITQELYAFLNKAGKVVPYISINGWLRVINDQPQYDGMDIDESNAECCTVTIYRKDRAHPTKITEWLRYCKRATAPWGQNPPRMLRHKTTMQCARYAFGLTGLHDEEDARQIARGGPEPEPALPVSGPPGPRNPIMSGTAARVREVLAEPAPAIAMPEVIEDEFRDSDFPEPPKTLESWVFEMENAPDQETAALVVDEARGLPIHAELSTAYRAKWTPKE